jgi:hypothetical protein
MGYIDHRGFEVLMEFGEFLTHPHAQRGIEIGKRLVEQKYFRFSHDEILRGKGYDSSHCITREFKDDGHNENAWAKRFEIPVLFLIGKP